MYKINLIYVYVNSITWRFKLSIYKTVLIDWSRIIYKISVLKIKEYKIENDEI